MCSDWPPPAPGIDGGLREQLREAIAAHLGSEGNEPEEARALVAALGPSRKHLWLAVEAAMNGRSDTRADLHLAFGYAVGLGAAAAGAGVGRIGDPDATALGARVAAAVLCQGIPLPEALAAARAALAALAHSLEHSPRPDPAGASPGGPHSGTSGSCPSRGL